MIEKDFQSSISTTQGFGVAGELYSDAPIVSQTYILNSADPSNNIFGRFFTFTNGGFDNVQAGGLEGTSHTHMAGFLVNLHHNSSRGNFAKGPLGQTTTLANGEIGEFLTCGFIYAFVNAGSTGVPRIGDYIFYSFADGSLVSSNQYPLNPPSGYSFAHARIDEFDPDAEGLCVIEVINVPLQEFA